MKNIFKTTAVILGVILFTILLYYSFKTKGDTATMIAGLWSALATIILGWIAIYQSKQYKRLSDKATEDYVNLQVQIKNLTVNMVEAIDTLKRIEKAKYYPNLEDLGYCFYAMDQSDYDRVDGDPDCVIQPNYLNVGQEDVTKEFVEIIRDYNIFAFYLKNIGEKTIRNFHCKKISLPLITEQYYSFFSNSSDIKPGQLVLVCIVNIPEYLSLIGTRIEMKFNMENLIGESYFCQSDISFYEDYEGQPTHVMQFLGPIMR